LFNQSEKIYLSTREIKQIEKFPYDALTLLRKLKIKFYNEQERPQHQRKCIIS